MEHVLVAQPGDEPAQFQLVAGSQEDYGLIWRKVIAELAHVRDGGMNGLCGLVTGRQVSPGDNVEAMALSWHGWNCRFGCALCQVSLASSA